MSGFSGSTERNPDATVYVGGIDQRVSPDVVWELFSQCGIVVNVHLPRDKITGEHQGYGFVEFKSEEDADYAIKIMHMVKLYQKPLKVNKASQDRRTQEVGANVFIGSIDPSITEMQIQDTFSAFGLILSRRIVRDPDTNESKGFSFISYDNFEAADNAISAMNGQFYGSQKITVSYAFKKDSKGERHGSAAANRPQQQIMMQGGGMGGGNNNAPAPLVPMGGVQRQNLPMMEGMMQPNGPQYGQRQYGGGNPQSFPPMQGGGGRGGYQMPPPLPSNMPPPPMYAPPPQMPHHMQQHGGGFLHHPGMGMPQMAPPPLPPGVGVGGGSYPHMPPPPSFMPPNMPNFPMMSRIN